MEVVLIVLFIAAAGAAVFFFLKQRSSGETIAALSADAARLGSDIQAARAESARLAGQLQATHEEAARLSAQVSAAHSDTARLAAQVRSLARYQTVVDADAEARRILTEAQGIHAQAQQTAQAWAVHGQQQAAAIEAQAKAAADRLLGEAHVTRGQAQTSADAAVAQARREAQQIIDVANKRAQEIAGEAFAASQDAKRLERTVQALKNVIEGYGDRHVMPTYGLLDELAEHFGYAEAGQRLKGARLRTRELIEQGHAAGCDYVEANRRETAIAFVLDAFNGKVDTILATVKEDNFGTLQQKIRDAFELVNFQGQPFRNARIEPGYLDARIDELRWAVVAQELRNREREEQRALKEKIREEERAQKEYERAQREAEKEQEMLRKALEKARREVDKASSDQRARYEEQLREVMEKLRVAEEKGQRALSMAQQTRTGHVYVISNIGSFGEDVFKVGLTRRLEPLDRVKELGDASVPFEFDVHALIPSSDAPALETALHKALLRRQVNKVNPRKEFFRATLHEIRAEVERMGLQASWTIAADAREYRESLAVEEAMAKGTFDERAWNEQQRKAARTPPPGAVAEALAE